MRLAETVCSRWVIALASIAVAGTAIAVAPRPVRVEPEVTKTVVKPWRGCHQRKAAPRPQPPVKHEITGADYREALMSVRPAFDACTRSIPATVTYSIAANIDGDGIVASVDVRGESPDLTQVDLHVVKCLEVATARVRFPGTGSPTRVATTIKKQ